MSFRMSFNRALIISFFWHLFWCFAVTIVIMPVGARQRGFSDVSFLGSILDVGSFQQEFEPRERYSHSDGFNMASERMLLLGGGKIYTEKVKPNAETDYLLKEKPYGDSIDEISEAEKRLPAISEKEPSPGPRQRHYELEGEPRSRGVLFIPPEPDCKIIIPSETGTGDYYEVSLKISVAPGGSVDSADILKSCGYPEVDLLAIRYMKKWNFVPLDRGQPQRVQEGTIRLKFKAR